MSYEEEFDRLMREKAGEMHYPFEESHWQKASELISKSRGGRYKALAWSGVVVIGVGISALLFTSTFHRSEQEVAAVVPVQEQSSGQQVHVVQPESPERLTVKAVSSSSQDSEKPETVVNRTETAPSAEVKESSSSVPSSKDNSTPPTLQNAPPAEVVKTPAPENKPEVMINASGDTENPIAAVVPAAGQERSEQTATPEVVNEVSAVEMLQGRSVFLTTATPELEAKPGAVTEVKLRDDDYYKAKGKPRTFYADMIGGGAYNMGWEKNGKQDGKGLNWYAGVNAGYFICRNVSIGTGFQMFNISHITEPFHGVRGKDYDFSSTSSKTVITCEQLQYFAVPLRFTWHTKPGELSLGLLGAQLWRADNTVESTVSRDNTVIDSKTSTNNDLYEGMTQQLLLINVGYALQMSNRLFINGEVVYGLTDLYGGTSYYAKGKEVPVTIRLGLTYRIIQR